MNNKHFPSNLTPRESFLMSLLNKITKEYKALLNFTQRIKPFKIVEIVNLSPIPGETKFMIQITNKNLIIGLTAAEIIKDGYNLDDFSDFHAELIRQSAQGKLIEFLKASHQEPSYKILSKNFSRDKKQFVFTIVDRDQTCFIRTAEEIANDKALLSNLGMSDLYDIGFTNGSESVIKEKVALILEKERNAKNA